MSGIATTKGVSAAPPRRCAIAHLVEPRRPRTRRIAVEHDEVQLVRRIARLDQGPQGYEQAFGQIVGSCGFLAEMSGCSVDDTMVQAVSGWPTSASRSTAFMGW